MQVEVYADMVFIINLIMDFFIFWTVSKLIRKNISRFRIFLGAFIASLLYCLLIFIDFFRRVYNIFGIAAVLMIAVAICFRPKSIKEFIKLIFLSNIASFAVGGTATALFYFTNISDIIGNMLGLTIHNFSFKVLIFSASISYIIIKLLVLWYKRLIVKRQSFCDIMVFLGESRAALHALIDTGNSLHEPISNKPVIVAEFSAVKEFLPDNVKVMYYENNENSLEKVLDCMRENKIHFRIIPFSSLGNQNGMLMGFKADKVTISVEKDIDLCDVIIGIYNFKLSSNGVYNALVNPEMLSETGASFGGADFDKEQVD